MNQFLFTCTFLTFFSQISWADQSPLSLHLQKLFKPAQSANEESTASNQNSLYELYRNQIKPADPKETEAENLCRYHSISDIKTVPIKDEFDPALSEIPSEIYRVHNIANETIFLIFFRSNWIQEMTFGRISDFIEATGAPLRTWPERHGLREVYEDDGHDHSVESIAYFFNELRRRNMKPGICELMLLEELVTRNLIKVSRDEGVQNLFSGKTSVAVISANHPPNPTTIRHEINHGVFFTDSTYRAEAFKLWKSLAENEKTAVRKVLNSDDYNHNDEGLIVREMLAGLRDIRHLIEENLPAEINRNDKITSGNQETIDFFYLIKGDTYYRKNNLAQILVDVHLKVAALDRYSRFYQVNHP